MMSYKTLKRALPIFQILIVLLTVNCSSTRTGVEIKILNRDKELIDNIAIVVASQQFPLGRLEPGEAAAVRVKPQAKSDIRVIFGVSEHDRQELVIDTKIDPNTYGTIEASIAGGRLGDIRLDVHN